MRRACRGPVGRSKMVNVLILRTSMKCRTPVALSKRRDRTVRVIKEEEEKEMTGRWTKKQRRDQPNGVCEAFMYQCS
jgi:hypothetical protein